MAQFSYKARRRTGEVVEGILDVADRSAALIQIERLGLFPVAVDAAKGGAVIAIPDRASSRNKTDWRAMLPPSLRAALSHKRKPKMQELATFTQQLANLLSSGMPLTVALNSMSHLETKGISAEVSKELKQDVMEGRSLSDSMAKQPRIYSDLYVNMVRAGESSGALVEVLRRMADHFERFAQVQAKFTGALIYPAFVAVVGVGIMFFFMTYMLPKFMTIFEGMNVPLPFLTQVLITISHDMFFSFTNPGVTGMRSGGIILKLGINLSVVALLPNPVGVSGDSVLGARRDRCTQNCKAVTSALAF